MIGKYSILRKLLALLCAAVTCQTATASAGTSRPDELAKPTAGKGFVITIREEDGITGLTARSVKRRIQEARDAGATVIIFELHTPGGEVGATLEITSTIKNMADVKTVAWVNTQAYSGGTIVAVACDEIVMARSAAMGDSQVIMMSTEGTTAIPEDLKAKVETPVLGEFSDSCRKNGYSTVMCASFARPKLEVWWLENIESGEREFVFADEKIKRLHEDKPSAPPAEDDSPAEVVAEPKPKSAPKWRLVKTYHDPDTDEEVKIDQPIVRDDLLLQMSSDQAVMFGFSKGVVTGDADLKTRYNLASLDRLTPNWSEKIAFYLTSMYVRGFLLILIFLGAYVEFNTPGVGVPGITALVCLAVFAGAPYLTGLANVWEIALIFVGFLLLGVEVFVIPGFGVAGIAGICCLVIGLVFTFIPDNLGQPFYIPTLPGTIETLKAGFFTVIGSMFLSLVGMVIVTKNIGRIPLLRTAVPDNPSPTDVMTEDPYFGAARIGDVGSAETVLRPAGKARFGNMLVDVVTEGTWIEIGHQVLVVKRLGNQVVVRQA